MIAPDMTSDAFVARLIQDVPQLLHLDADGQLLVIPDHGHRNVSRRILTRTVGHLPDPQTIAHRSFYRDLEAMIREMDPKAAKSIGLVNMMPPPGVNVMTRDKQVFFDFRNADAIEANLRAAGFDFADGARVLDFGCASGRTLRTLDLAYPQVKWSGVDVIAGDITWAKTAMPQIDFQTSPQTPPLAFEAGHFDAVYGASVWSHFAATTARDWFAEMARIIRPGGSLCFTAHGYYDLAKKVIRQNVTLDQATQIRAEMDSSGHAFWANIAQGARGDQSDIWGTCFLTRDWVEQQVLGTDWTLARHAIGEWGGRQDIYVLLRR